MESFASAAVSDPELHCGIQFTPDADRMKQAWNARTPVKAGICSLLSYKLKHFAPETGIFRLGVLQAFNNSYRRTFGFSCWVKG